MHIVFFPRLVLGFRRGFDYALNLKAYESESQPNAQYYLAELAPVRRPVTSDSTKGMYDQVDFCTKSSWRTPYRPWVIVQAFARSSKQHTHRISFVDFIEQFKKLEATC